MLPSDDPFAELVAMSDAAINQQFARSFTLRLATGATLDVIAIYDTQQDEARTPNGNGSGRVARASAINGTLTVLGYQLDREQVKGAHVTTSDGERVVYDIDYPDEDSTILKLSEAGDVITAPSGGYFPSISPR